MNEEKMLELARDFLDAWNSQDVERVVACYTEDLDYRDPNTRGAVAGIDGMRRYLRKLFAKWQMHWSLREAHLFATKDGCAVLWHATFRNLHKEEGAKVEADGMDLVTVRDGRIARNEVYFDRAILAPLL